MCSVPPSDTVLRHSNAWIHNDVRNILHHHVIDSDRQNIVRHSEVDVVGVWLGGQGDVVSAEDRSRGLELGTTTRRRSAVHIMDGRRSHHRLPCGIREDEASFDFHG